MGNRFLPFTTVTHCSQPFPYRSFPLPHHHRLLHISLGTLHPTQIIPEITVHSQSQDEEQCQGLAGPWYARRERGAVGARVQ